MIAFIVLLAALLPAPSGTHRLVYMYAAPPNNYIWNDHHPHPADAFLFRRLQPRLERLFSAAVVAETSPSKTYAEACAGADAAGAIVVSREDRQIGTGGAIGAALELRSCSGYPFLSIVRMAHATNASPAEMANLWFDQIRFAADHVYETLAARVNADPSAALNFATYGMYMANRAKSVFLRLEESGPLPVRVKNVYPGGPAARAPVKEGDEIARVNGEDASLLTQTQLDRITDANRPITLVLRGPGAYASRVRRIEPRNLAWYVANASPSAKSVTLAKPTRSVASAKLVYVDGVNAQVMDRARYEQLYAQLVPQLEGLYGSRIARYTGSVQGYGLLQRVCRSSGALAVISVGVDGWTWPDWYASYSLYSCDGWQWLSFRTTGTSSGDIIAAIAKGISAEAKSRMPDRSIARNLLLYGTYLADDQRGAFFRVDKEPVDRSVLEQMQYGRSPSAPEAVPYLTTGTIFIESVLQNGPAYRAGLRAGDVLLSIDGRSIDGLRLEQIDDLIAAAPAKAIQLQIRRPDDSITTLQITAERASAVIASP